MKNVTRQQKEIFENLLDNYPFYYKGKFLQVTEIIGSEKENTPLLSIHLKEIPERLAIKVSDEQELLGALLALSRIQMPLSNDSIYVRLRHFLQGTTALLHIVINEDIVFESELNDKFVLSSFLKMLSVMKINEFVTKTSSTVTKELYLDPRNFLNIDELNDILNVKEHSNYSSCLRLDAFDGSLKVSFYNTGVTEERDFNVQAVQAFYKKETAAFMLSKVLTSTVSDFVANEERTELFNFELLKNIVKQVKEMV